MKLELPECPHCGKKINYIKAWALKREGEYWCGECGGFANVQLDGLGYLLGFLVILIGVFTFLTYLLVVDGINFWILFFYIFPYLVFVCLSPLCVRLADANPKGKLPQHHAQPSVRSGYPAASRPSQAPRREGGPPPPRTPYGGPPPRQQATASPPARTPYGGAGAARPKGGPQRPVQPQASKPLHGSVGAAPRSPYAPPPRATPPSRTGQPQVSKPPYGSAPRPTASRSPYAPPPRATPPSRPAAGSRPGSDGRGTGSGKPS